MAKKKISFLAKLTGAKKSKKSKIKKTAKPVSASKQPWSPEPEGELSIDVYQTENDIIIKALIAGTKAKDLDISITNDMVTIKGQRKHQEVVKSDNYYYQECYWGKFSRSIILPTEISVDHAEAIFKNGLLTVILPKSSKVKSKKIEVKIK